MVLDHSKFGVCDSEAEFLIQTVECYCHHTGQLIRRGLEETLQRHKPLEAHVPKKDPGLVLGMKSPCFSKRVLNYYARPN